MSSNVSALITLQNSSGVVAQNAVTSVTYNDHASPYPNQGSGATVGDRSSGATPNGPA